MGTGSGATVLAIGDVHLGTRPASLPVDLDVDARALAPAAGLAIAVERAIEVRVDAVLFAGDVVESTNARFEAMAPLERAVRRLSEEGIAVIGVAGNHDVEALPRLAARIEGFTLLGAEGVWSSKVIMRAGRPVLEVVGWSFPQRKVASSPVAALLRSPLPPRFPDVPRLGILHGDLDASKGLYAPFTSREIEQVGLDAWVFGHIHRPSLAVLPVASRDTGHSAGTDRSNHSSGGTDQTLSGYLGSLVGLDPGETGAHGPWRIRVSGSGAIEAEQWAIAPIRWERLRLSLEEDEDADDFADRMVEAVAMLARQIERRDGAPKVLGVQVVVAGATRHYPVFRRRIEEGDWTTIRRQVGAMVVFVHRVIDDLRLAVDLEAMARGDDPPALIARKLLALRSGGAVAQALLESARAELGAFASDPLWRRLDDARDAGDPLSDEALRGVLEQTATAALDALLSQRDAPVGEDG